MRSGIVIVQMVALLGGCGGGGGTFALDDGTEVVVSSAGDVQLFAGDRPIFATSPKYGPIVRTFEEEWLGALAIWEFSRRDLSEHELSRFRGVEGSGGGVVLRYESRRDGWSGEMTIEPGPPQTTRIRLEIAGGVASSIAVPVRCDDEGSFHGFGEQYNATDQRGESFELLVSEQGIGRTGLLRPITGDAHSTYFPMPYYLDVRGFGALFETPYRVIVDLCQGDDEIAWFEVVSGEPVELLVFHGPTMLDVIDQLGARVGRPTQPPAWAHGVWIAAQGGRDAVMADVLALQQEQIPFSALWVQDWTGIRRNLDGGFGVQYRWASDEELYPDLPEMIAELQAQGYRFLGYANPFVDPELPDHFDEMDREGWLVKDPETGESYRFTAPNVRSGHPDLTNPAARAYVVAALRAMAEDYGMDGWMVDFGEWLPLDAVLSDGSDPRAYHNLYPIEWQRVNREALEAARPDGDWVTFARSGWTGVQGVAQIHWAGDQEADWSIDDGLPTVVPAMLTMGLSGQPYVTHDIAGFSGGPSTKELYLRWTELGAFTPIMRTHEGNDKENNWQWHSDRDTIAHFRRFASIHLALADDFERLAAEAQQTSAPIVRHLMLAFPDDPETHQLSDQFLIGDELLIAPVLVEGAATRTLYLPAGTWYHVWTGTPHEGGRHVTVDAPIGQPPVFSRGADRPELRAVWEEHAPD